MGLDCNQARRCRRGREPKLVLYVSRSATIAQMTPVSVLPTKDKVIAACEEYANDLADIALTALFAQYPRNDNEAHVLLNVVAVNRLYSTNILAVYDVASHIHQIAAEIDAGVQVGSPEVVDRIAQVRLRATGKTRNVWSFASTSSSGSTGPTQPFRPQGVDLITPEHCARTPNRLACFRAVFPPYNGPSGCR